MRILRSVDESELRSLSSNGECVWLDLDDPDDQTLDMMAEVLDLHELAIEDTKEFGQRPKLDVYDDELLMVYYGGAEGNDSVPVAVEVHIHIRDRFVLTVHRRGCRQFDHVQRQLEIEPPDTERLLIYRVIDALTDSLLDVLEKVADSVDELESQVFRRPRSRDRDRMATMRRGLNALRRLLIIQRQVFDRTVERIDSLPGLDEDLTNYYRDVGDHLWRAVDEIDSARDTLQGLLDTYTNEVQERLTIVATIFLPLTVITGFFGMNFNWMISHIGQAWAFWGLGLGGLLVSGGGIWLWLVRSGLYHGKGSDAEPIDRPRE